MLCCPHCNKNIRVKLTSKSELIFEKDNELWKRILPNDEITIEEGFDLKKALNEVKKIYIQKAIAKTCGSISKAAKLLNLPEKTFFRYRRELKI